MRTILQRVAVLPGLALLLAYPVACDVDQPCDEGLRFEDGVCVPETAMPEAGMGGGPVEADAEPVAPTSDAGTDAGCTQPLDDALGKACATSAECGCAADYCAVMPGQAMGFCTLSGCDPDADDCPQGYACFDLSALGVMGVEPFCLRQ